MCSARPVSLNMKKDVDLDEILLELGQFGKFQILHFVMLSLPMAMACFAFNSYIFVSSDTPYRCLIPECEEIPEGRAVFHPDWLTFTIPKDENGHLRPCEKFEPLENATCRADHFTNSTERCQHWVHEDKTSIISEWNLTCDENKWKLALTGTLMFFGCFMTKPLTGFVADRIGRKKAILGASGMMVICGVVRALSPNYIMFQVMTFLEGMVGGGIYATCLIMGLELLDPKKRVLGGSLLSCLPPICHCLLALFTWLFQNWRHYLLSLYLPGILLVSYICFLSESPRWLIAKGRLDEARVVVERVARLNGVKLSPEHFVSVASLHRSKEKLAKETTSHLSPGVFTQMFRSKLLLRRLALCMFNMFSVAFVLTGLTMHSTGVLEGNRYVNFVLVALVELPAQVTTYFGMNRYGRKKTLFCSQLVGGAACVGFAFISHGARWGRLSLYLVGKLFIAVSFVVMLMFGAELFPTPLRQSVTAVTTMFGNLGAVLAPQTLLLEAYMESLSLLLFGVVALVACGATLLLPETKGLRLPDSVAEAEAIGARPSAPDPAAAPLNK